LSENIYRYNHDDFDKRDGLGGIHTINESSLRSSLASIPHPVLTGALVDIRADSLLEMIKFFVALILNADEASDL